jgi:hypothetical protein
VWKSARRGARPAPSARQGDSPGRVSAASTTAAPASTRALALGRRLSIRQCFRGRRSHPPPAFVKPRAPDLTLWSRSPGTTRGRPSRGGSRARVTRGGERVRADDDRVSGEFWASWGTRFGFLERFLTRWLSVYRTEGHRFESCRARSVAGPVALATTDARSSRQAPSVGWSGSTTGSRTAIARE